METLLNGYLGYIYNCKSHLNKVINLQLATKITDYIYA